MNAQLPIVQPKVALMAGNRPTAIVPESIEQVWRLSELMSKSGLAPKDLDSPEKCAIAILHGLEVGLSPMQAVQKIAVINGRPTIWGDAALGLVKASGICDSIVEVGDENSAQCTVKRSGEDATTRSFSTDDAKRAKLLDKPGPWQQYRKRMLQMRARGFALRDVFPDVLGGMYIREELEGSDDFKGVTSVEPPTPPEPPAIAAKPSKEWCDVAARREGDCEVGAGIKVPEPRAATMEAKTSDYADTVPAPPTKAPGVDALGGIPAADVIPPGLRRATVKKPTATDFDVEKWLSNFAPLCNGKTPAQLLELREKTVEPMRKQLGHDGYNRAGDLMGAAMEAAQKAAEPKFDPDQWYRDLEGAISGCTSAAQVFDVQEKVQKPALEKVSREHYARGKKLVAAALMQLADED